jgi:phage tail-like protein
MSETSKLTAKRLMEYLPGIYRDDSSRDGDLSTFLFAFEALLLEGAPDIPDLGREVEPLERKISRLHLIFNPSHTPEEFLPWLAGWAALTLHARLNPARRRKLLSRIIPLYRIRGTREYLEELLTLCIDTPCAVSDAELPALRVETHSLVGVDTRIGGGPPHFFNVKVVASSLSPEEASAQADLAINIIELAKPAHTYYELEIIAPQMQVGTHSTVGLDTVLGGPAHE